jgi:alpha-tubulin suppressor-like RCC1 family protein
MWCQGSDNVSGEMGDGTQGTGRPDGVQVGTDGDWIDAAAGTQFSCGLRADALYCWGRDDIGQLGDGGPTDKQLSPVPSTKLHGWTKIAAGAWAACGIQSDQTLWCWGQDHGLTGGWDVPVWVAAP